MTVTDRNLSLDFRAPPPAPDDEGAGAGKPKDEGPRALSVAELDRSIRESLELSFDVGLWVEGEVTSARPAPSGHVYFCLKDEREDASIDAVVYKNSVSNRGRALLKDGARVRLRGRPTFYSPRGRLQFIADRVEAVGRGALLEALEALKEKLGAEGLFAPERKRRLPVEPRIIGVVTSPTGAVIHDVCKVAFRRGGARILLAPARVQGDGAADSILRALRALQRIAGVDVIIVGRGGGSADDLFAFSDEALVRAVAACRVPVVSAVGHEVDVTLVDFAADARAATPSQAAEMVVPDRRARASHLRQIRERLVHSMRARLAEDRVRLGALERKLADPRLAIASQQQRLDDRVERLAAWSRSALARGASGWRGSNKSSARSTRSSSSIVKGARSNARRTRCGRRCARRWRGVKARSRRSPHGLTPSARSRSSAAGTRSRRATTAERSAPPAKFAPERASSSASSARGSRPR